MRRLMLLGVVLALCGATVASAELFGTFTTGAESVVLNYARAPQSGALAGLDLITLTVGSISLDPGTQAVQRVLGLGAEPSQGTGGNALFQALGNGYMVVGLVDLGDGPVPYPNRVTPTALPAPDSYVNFVSSNGFAGTEAGITLPAGYGDVAAFSSFSDTWFTSTASQYIAVNGTLAKLYVPTGSNVELTGSLGMSISGTGCLGHGTTLVPEPGTLALLAGGLVGLIAYAWRKRK